MPVRRRSSSLLQYDADLLPESGLEVCSACAAPVKQASKDAAGHAFHALARRQSGLDKGASLDGCAAKPGWERASRCGAPGPLWTGLPDAACNLGPAATGRRGAGALAGVHQRSQADGALQMRTASQMPAPPPQRPTCRARRLLRWTSSRLLGRQLCSSACSRSTQSATISGRSARPGAPLHQHCWPAARSACQPCSWYASTSSAPSAPCAGRSTRARARRRSAAASGPTSMR